MTVQAFISDDYVGMRVRIAIVQDFGAGRPSHILRHAASGHHEWVELGEDAPVEPTLTLSTHEAVAVLDALTRHFHGAEDTRALRRDYDAERRRVDEQAKVIADVARALAGKEAGR